MSVLRVQCKAASAAFGARSSTLRIHGARAVRKVYQQNPAKMPASLQRLLQRKHPNVVCVVLASRNARVAWAMLGRSEDYRVTSTPTDSCAASGAGLSGPAIPSTG